MLVGPLYILDTASFEWRPEQERTLSQVRVALQSARMVVLKRFNRPNGARCTHGGKDTV